MWQYIKRAGPITEKNMGDTAEWPPFCASGGSEKFSVLAKRGGLALFEFLGGS